MTLSGPLKKLMEAHVLAHRLKNANEGAPKDSFGGSDVKREKLKRENNHVTIVDPLVKLRSLLFHNKAKGGGNGRKKTYKEYTMSCVKCLNTYVTDAKVSIITLDAPWGKGGCNAKQPESRKRYSPDTIKATRPVGAWEKENAAETYANNPFMHSHEPLEMESPNEIYTNSMNRKLLYLAIIEEFRERVVIGEGRTVIIWGPLFWDQGPGTPNGTLPLSYPAAFKEKSDIVQGESRNICLPLSHGRWASKAVTEGDIMIYHSLWTMVDPRKPEKDNRFVLCSVDGDTLLSFLLLADRLFEIFEGDTSRFTVLWRVPGSSTRPDKFYDLVEFYIRLVESSRNEFAKVDHAHSEILWVIISGLCGNDYTQHIKGCGPAKILGSYRLMREKYPDDPLITFHRNGGDGSGLRDHYGSYQIDEKLWLTWMFYIVQTLHFEKIKSHIGSSVEVPIDPADLERLMEMISPICPTLTLLSLKAMRKQSLFMLEYFSNTTFNYEYPGSGGERDSEGNSVWGMVDVDGFLVHEQ